MKVYRENEVGLEGTSICLSEAVGQETEMELLFEAMMMRLKLLNELEPPGYQICRCCVKSNCSFAFSLLIAVKSQRDMSDSKQGIPVTIPL